jgi:hypothetical protein
MASEPVLEVVPEEALVEGAMIVVHVAAPSPPHGAATTSSPAPRTTAVASAAAGVAVGPKVIMGHPTFYAPDDIRLDESVSLAHRLCPRCNVYCTGRMRVSRMSAGACSCGLPCTVAWLRSTGGGHQPARHRLQVGPYRCAGAVHISRGPGVGSRIPTRGGG